MKKLIIFLAIMIFATPAMADIILGWDINNAALMTEQNVYYRVDPGVSGDQALLDGTGFTPVGIPLAEREYRFTNLTPEKYYCFYVEAKSENSTNKSDVLCGRNGELRTVKRITFLQMVDGETITPVR